MKKLTIFFGGLGLMGLLNWFVAGLVSADCTDCKIADGLSAPWILGIACASLLAGLLFAGRG